MFKFVYSKAIKLSPNTCVSLLKKMWCIAISGHHGIGKVRITFFRSLSPPPASSADRVCHLHWGPPQPALSRTFILQGYHGMGREGCRRPFSVYRQASPHWFGRVSKLVSIACRHRESNPRPFVCGNDALTDCAMAAAPVRITTKCFILQIS